MAKRRNFVKTPSATGKAGHRATHSMKIPPALYGKCAAEM